MPDVSGGVTAPGAALRYSLAPGVKVVQSKDYSAALANPNTGNFYVQQSEAGAELCGIRSDGAFHAQ